MGPSREARNVIESNHRNLFSRYRLKSSTAISSRTISAVAMLGTRSQKVSSSKESFKMNKMLRTFIYLLSSGCNQLIWILLVLVTIPVGPYNQVVLIHSQTLTRQWSTRVVTTKQGLTRGFLFLPRGHEGVEVRTQCSIHHYYCIYHSYDVYFIHILYLPFFPAISLTQLQIHHQKNKEIFNDISQVEASNVGTTRK